MKISSLFALFAISTVEVILAIKIRDNEENPQLNLNILGLISYA